MMRCVFALVLLAIPPLFVAASAGSARGQVSQVSELWRERDALEVQWKAERAVIEADRRRLRDRRAARGADPKGRGEREGEGEVRR